MNKKSQFLKSAKLAIASVALFSSLSSCTSEGKHSCMFGRKSQCSTKNDKASCNSKDSKSVCSSEVKGEKAGCACKDGKNGCASATKAK